MRWERPPLLRPDSTEIIELCKTDFAKSKKRCADVQKTISQTKAHIAESKELLSRIETELRRSPLKL